MASRERPLSPHIQIYKPQMTSVLSITHRTSGVVLAVGSLLLVYWLVAGGVIIAVEINGLIGPGAATQKPLTTVSGTIHGGLALWLVLYLAGAFLNS